MPIITLPDKSTREFPDSVSGLEVAKSIGPKLAKHAVAVRIGGSLKDLATMIDRDVDIEIVTRDSEEGLEILRHDAAHVMAEAVKELHPEIQVTIGPAIENGFYYDFARAEPFTPDDLEEIEARMREIVVRDEKITRECWRRDDAVQFFQTEGEHYKAEIIQAIPDKEEITLYRQGNFIDLCRGPHLPSTGRLGNAFKLTKLAGAYWRGDSSKTMLTRIYGTAWRNKKELEEYLIQLDEAEKRDHRKLGKEMNLFHFQEEAPGAVFWHPKGWYLFQSLINYMRKRQEDADYVETNTPDLLDRSLWETSGHWEKFGENMFTTEAKEERVFAIKPMNCPGAVEVYKQGLKSYRDLPLRMAEFGKVHRYEPSGALHGLMRVRAFTQDDAHIFCTEDQITTESKNVCDLILSIYKDFGFENVRINYSDRPKKRVGSDEIWDKAEKALMDAAETTGLKYSLNSGDGAFYGPKLDFVLRDAIGRDWQCGTLQVDLNLPGRLNAIYIGEDGQKKTPVMLHRALFGSLERFAGILIEHYAGHLPFWLSPLQIIIATITSDSDIYADNIFNQLKDSGLRVEKDIRNEKIGYKIREHSAAKIPVIMVIGKKESENKTVSVRRLGSEKNEIYKIDEILKILYKESLAPNSKE